MIIQSCILIDEIYHIGHDLATGNLKLTGRTDTVTKT